MAEIIRLARSAHDEAQLLLPWYVNGTLDGAELDAFKSHVAECDECRVELTAERLLKQRIGEMPIPAIANAPRPFPVPSLLQRRVPIAWALAGPLAAAAAAFGVAMYLPSQPSADGAEYEALSSAEVQTTGNLVVVFRPEQPERAIRKALIEVEAQIVAGPNVSGAYVLHVAQSRRPQALVRLRAMPAVVIAEPIDRDG